MSLCLSGVNNTKQTIYHFSRGIRIKSYLFLYIFSLNLRLKLDGAKIPSDRNVDLQTILSERHFFSLKIYSTYFSDIPLRKGEFTIDFQNFDEICRDETQYGTWIQQTINLICLFEIDFRWVCVSKK